MLENKTISHLLDAPTELLKLRNHNALMERTFVRTIQNGMREVDITNVSLVALIYTIAAVFWSAVGEHVKGTNERFVVVPPIGIGRYIAKEERDGEGSANFVLFD